MEEKKKNFKYTKTILYCVFSVVLEGCDVTGGAEQPGQ